MTIAALFAAAAIAASGPHWLGSWASAQQIPEPRNALATEDLTDATLREIVHVSLGGHMFRVRISNAFGTQPVTLMAHAALAASPAAATIVPATDHALTFNGSTSVTIPAGADYWSDPVDMPLSAQADLAISLYYAKAPEQQTSHPGSRATSYLVHGNQLSAADLPSPKTVDHWFNLSGVDVDAQGDALVTLGDSITDGHGATTNGNDRWPDLLTQRLGQQNISVLNVGIGGNRVLLDGLGPNSAARFTRDVLAQSHARYVIVFEGVNDLGTSTREAPISPEEHAALVQRIESAYAQMIQEAHDHGLTIIGATITPYGGSDYYHPDQSNESDRQAINAWIRAPGHFDEVVDFDAAVRDDQRPDHLRAQYDTGDHLHPSVAGYRAMIDAIPPNLFMQVAKPAPHRHHGRRHRKT